MDRVAVAARSWCGFSPAAAPHCSGGSVLLLVRRLSRVARLAAAPPGSWGLDLFGRTCSLGLSAPNELLSFFLLRALRWTVIFTGSSCEATGSTAEGDNQDTLGPFPDVMPDSYRLKLTIRKTTGEGMPRRAI